MKDECAEHKQEGWATRRTTKGLECSGQLQGGSSYVHDYLHNHNICYVKIYISSDFVSISLSPRSCFNVCEALL